MVVSTNKLSRTNFKLNAITVTLNNLKVIFLKKIDLFNRLLTKI